MALLEGSLALPARVEGVVRFLRLAYLPGTRYHGNVELSFKRERVRLEPTGTDWNRLEPFTEPVARSRAREPGSPASSDTVPRRPRAHAPRLAAAPSPSAR